MKLIFELFGESIIASIAMYVLCKLLLRFSKSERNIEFIIALRNAFIITSFVLIPAIYVLYSNIAIKLHLNSI